MEAMNLAAIAANANRDDVLVVVEGIARRVLSPHWDVYVDRERYENMLLGDLDGALATYSLMRPTVFDGFEEVIIASACMEDTMLARLWRAQGYVLEEVGCDLKNALRYQSHTNGADITVYYASEEAWSKSFRDRKVETGGTTRVHLDLIVEAVSTLIGNEPFVWMGNKDLPADIFGHLRAERLPNSPHGLNGFQHAHAVVVLSALNPPPAHFRFMGDEQSIDGDAIRAAHYRTAVYQAVMRCSIRNPADRSPKRVVVMDKETADWLATKFPGATVLPLPGMKAAPTKGKPGRPRKYASNADRARAYRARKRGIDVLAALEASSARVA